MAHNHINEERLVDFALGNLSETENQAIENHLRTCGQCEEEVNYWKQVFATENAAVPSPSLTNRMNETIDKQPHKRPRKLWQKPAIASISAVAIFMLCFGLYQLVYQNPVTDSQHQGYIVAQHDQIPEKIFMQKPDTNRLDVVPVTNNSQVSSNVWLNKKTNEMLVNVDGLTPLTTKDYQLWLVKTNNDWRGELLNLRNGSIKVYYKGSDIKLLKYIKVSIEPRGGSLTPTGPETIFIDLKQ